MENTTIIESKKSKKSRKDMIKNLSEFMVGSVSLVQTGCTLDGGEFGGYVFSFRTKHGVVFVDCTMDLDIETPFSKLMS